MGGGVSYHERTAYRRGGLGGGFLDWNTRPEIFKTYQGLPTVVLPELDDLQRVSRPFFKMLWEPVRSVPDRLDLKTLSRMLTLTYGITAQSGRGADAFFFRSVPSAGALYPCELYVAVQGIVDLEDGLYHYDLARYGLVRLRSGRFLSSKARWAAAFFVTTLFFRSSWKYRDRAYRYCLLDAGHLVENALLVLHSDGIKACVWDRFQDKELNAFLGVDSQREVCVAVIAFSHEVSAEEAETTGFVSEEFRLLEKSHTWDLVQPEACRLSVSDKVPSSILEAHWATESMEASGTAKADEPHEAAKAQGDQEKTRKIPRPKVVPESLSFEESVWRRRSQRNYVSAHVSRQIWQTLWHSLNLDKALCDAVEIFIACGEAEDLPAGLYAWKAASQEARTIFSGDFRRASAHACLDQGWLRHALFHVAYVVDWKRVFGIHGPRGYRSALLDAGRLGQRLYLASTALGMGCCGIGAYYDDELRTVFRLGSGWDVVYLTASGPVKKLRS